MACDCERGQAIAGLKPRRKRSGTTPGVQTPQPFNPERHGASERKEWGNE